MKKLLVAATATLMMFSPAAFAQQSDCRAFAGAWKGQTPQFDPVEFAVSADGATLTYKGQPAPCSTTAGRIKIKYPQADIEMGLDGKGEARDGVQTKKITMKRQ